MSARHRDVAFQVVLDAVHPGRIQFGQPPEGRLRVAQLFGYERADYLDRQRRDVIVGGDSMGMASAQLPRMTRIEFTNRRAVDAAIGAMDLHYFAAVMVDDAARAQIVE